MEATILQSTNRFDFTSIESLLCAVVFTVLVMLLSLAKWNRKQFDQWLMKITGPPARSIIATGYDFIGTSSEQSLMKIIEYINIYSPEPFKILLPHYQGVVLTKPEDIQVVLNSSKALQKDQRLYHVFRNMIGDSIAITSVDKWRKLRRLIHPTLNSNILEKHNLVFNEKTKHLIKYLENELNNTQPFDIIEYISINNISIILETATGYNFDNQYDDIVKCMETIPIISELDIMKLFKPWLYPDIIFSIYLKLTGQQVILNTINRIVAQIIKKRKDDYNTKLMADNKSSIEDTEDDRNYSKIFLDKLLDVDNHPDLIFSDEDLGYEVNFILGAGSETSSCTLSFCILLLAIHQDIQNKVYDEIYNVFGDDDQIITNEDTNKLVYMDQVLRETLRIFPPLPFILRKLEENVKIESENCILRKGTSCFISPMATHYNPELYPNPSAFNPENFNDENITKRHKYSWIPFSGGPRGCLGYKYAMLSMKVQLTMLLRNYSFHSDYTMSDIKLKFDIVLRSVNGCPVTIRPRDKQLT